jgi:hypothetical protein
MGGERRGARARFHEIRGRGRLEESWPLVEQLGTAARDLLRQVEGLSVETLRRQAGTAPDPEQTVAP